MQVGKPVGKLNASYTHGTRTFEFPWVYMRGKTFYTNLDRGIVSHEAGHMVLFNLKSLSNTPHTRAFHEAFGDLTSFFYRYYNKRTRQDFLDKLGQGNGCVGDTPFTCVRNANEFITLTYISQDKDRCEEHEFSKVFSSAVFNNMATAYAHRGRFTQREHVAGDIVTWHRRTLVKAVLSLETSQPTLMDIAEKMLRVSDSTSYYRDGLGRNFIKNGLIVLMYRFPTFFSRGEYYYEPNQKYSALCLEKREEKGNPGNKGW